MLFTFVPNSIIPDRNLVVLWRQWDATYKCRKKAQFYIRIQLHSDGTTWLQSHKGTAGRNTVHVASLDRHVYDSTAAAGNDKLTARYGHTAAAGNNPGGVDRFHNTIF